MDKVPIPTYASFSFRLSHERLGGRVGDIDLQQGSYRQSYTEAEAGTSNQKLTEQRHAR
jgi:hypothetical protein